MGYYRVAGLDKEIVNEHFSIIDEVEDCKVLFDKLNEMLTASWDLMYLKAKEYFEINGNTYLFLNDTKRRKGTL